jgi:GNAT superfamily N-acetyltransferase
MSTPDVRPAVVTVRRALPGDREALTLMHERCTIGTSYQRFHGPLKAIPEPYLTEALSGSPVHYALVASPDAGLRSTTSSTETSGPAPIIALASCRAVAEGAAELGVLVEDDWQRHGLGVRLLADLVAHAHRKDFRVLQAQVLPEQAWIAGLLRRHGSCQQRTAPGGVVHLTLRLTPQASAVATPAASGVAPAWS